MSVLFKGHNDRSYGRNWPFVRAIMTVFRAILIVLFDHNVVKISRPIPYAIIVSRLTGQSNYENNVDQNLVLFWCRLSHYGNGNRPQNFYDIILHNVAMIFLVYSICHNEKALPDRSNYGNNVDRNENNDDQCWYIHDHYKNNVDRCWYIYDHYGNNVDRNFEKTTITKIMLTDIFKSCIDQYINVSIKISMYRSIY